MQTAEQINVEPCPFRIGDLVRVVPNPDRPWSMDWVGVPAEYVAGIDWQKGGYSLTLSECWPPKDGLTDGFDADALELVTAARCAWDFAGNGEIGDTGRFMAWSVALLASECRAQARTNLDPEYCQFMRAVAARLTQPVGGAK